ncbi:MucB/RseB-like sigma(E) regulatory protein [Modestobacter roseus]|uniref:MucB/RseB-like sigma(E) regulatory protein n=1 Tax=Modestobacter roseus TaxID=1181884 RepID=A0A562INC6_9ACTN|nr:transcriptional regulator [Modestobacter roseus]TWH72346.1 MucB/RseB-like sigma(E) regulatory protein [Modestobacter roseus]
MVTGVVLLVSLPALVAALPATDASVSAPELRAQALASAGVAHSGYAQAAGGLSLPVGQQLTPVADLLSDRTSMRTWYRSPQDWRVDVVSPTGETGVYRDSAGVWTWEYEDAVVTRAGTPPLALPTAPDLLPTALGWRLLSEADEAELSRAPAARVAGRDALGLRLVPAADASSIARVDVWVDSATGLPLRVRVVGEGGSDADPALDTAFLDVDLADPGAAASRFTPPPARDLRTGPDEQLYEAARTGLRDGVVLPPTLAGLARRDVPGTPASVGAYGRGVTVLVAVPLPDRAADGLRRALRRSPDAVADPAGVRLSAGPLGLMLVDGSTGPLLLTGTVDGEALAGAAAELTGGGR